MIKNIRKNRTILAMCTVACVSVCIFSACGSNGNSDTDVTLVQEEEDAGYATATVEYGEVVQNAEISCTYTPTEHQDLAFMLDDRLIERVEVKKGDIVSEGDLLAAVDVGDLEDRIAELEYQINHKSLELTHTQELKAFDIDSAKILYEHTEKTESDKEDLQEKLEDIEDQYHDTIQDLEDSILLNQKRLEKYREELSGGQLIAGISGEVTYILSPLVDTYSEKETKVITISNLDSCYFIADDVTYADFFKGGESVNVVYKKDKKETYVEVTPVNIDQWQNQMCFKPVNDEIFESGLVGTIYMELEKKSNVLCVPNDALHEAEDGMFVYVLENELLNMRYVEVGLKGAEVTEIVSGLEQGELVVLK